MDPSRVGDNQPVVYLLKLLSLLSRCERDWGPRRYSQTGVEVMRSDCRWLIGKERQARVDKRGATYG